MLSSGALAWARANLFSSIGSTVVTIGCVALAAYLLPQLVAWATTRAIWSASDGAACRQHQDGACWAFVIAKWDYLRFGSYPLAERWRVDVGGGGRRRFDHLVAVDQRAAAGLGRVPVFRHLSDSGAHPSARLILAWSADCRYPAVGGHFRFAADGRRRDRLLFAARRASCAWTPFAAAGRPHGERRIHRVRAGRAVHYDLVHGQQSVAVVRARNVDARSLDASIGRHHHIFSRVYGGRSAWRSSVFGNGDNTKQRWRWD